MTNNELILSTASVPSKFSFKNAKLNELSGKIAAHTDAMNKLYNDTKQRAEAINSALAPIFGELLTSKCYADDGFKSVADYAEQTFGIGKSMAYMLARVGKEFYNEGSETTAKARAALTVSKLGELTGVDRIAIAKAIDSGELSKDSSLQDCREFAAAHRKPGKEKVLPTFTVVDMRRTCVFWENVTKEEMYEQVAASIVADHPVHAESEGAVYFSPAKLNGDKASAAQHFIAYTATGFARMYEYRPYVKPESKGKKVKRDKFDLAAYIKSLSPEERDALAAMVKGE